MLPAGDAESSASTNRIGPPNLTIGQSISATGEQGNTRNCSNSNATSSPSANISIGSDHLTRQHPKPKCRQFLAICINTGQYITKLGEIELSTISKDGELFAKITDKYRQLRQFRIKRVFMRPVNVHIVLVCMKSAHLSFRSSLLIASSEKKVQSTTYLQSRHPRRSPRTSTPIGT